MGRSFIGLVAVFAAFLIVAWSQAFVGFAIAKPQTSGYRLAQKVTLGGEGGWDYFEVDPTTHRAFIPRRTHTMVVDAVGKVVADIHIMGSHTIAFAPEFNRVFTSDNEEHTVTIIDPEKLEIVGKVKIPDRNPDSILYDPSSKRLFTFNTDGGNDATAVDAKTGRVMGNVPLGGKPETAQADGTGRIYVNIEDKNEVIEFDAKTLKVINTWPIAPCNEPAGLAIDIAHKRRSPVATTS